MSACELELKQWGGYDLYTCDRCNIRTLSEATYLARCEARRTGQPLTSSSGLLGPSGDQLPPPPEQDELSSHDDMAGGRPVRSYAIPVEAQEVHDQ